VNGINVFRKKSSVFKCRGTVVAVSVILDMDTLDVGFKILFLCKNFRTLGAGKGTGKCG